MEIQGKITAINEVQSGEGANGTWSKQEFVIETLDSKYPKKVCISVWGADKVENLTKYNKVGDVVNCSIELESREFNGKWYTSIQAWKITKTKAEAKQEKPTNESEELPF